MRCSGLSFFAAISAASALLDSLTPAALLNKRGVNLIHHPGAEDHLDLAGVAEAAFDAVQFADGLFVHLAVVHQHQAQARGAVGGAGDVLFTAEQRQQRVGGCGNVHVVPLLN